MTRERLAAVLAVAKAPPKLSKMISVRLSAEEYAALHAAAAVHEVGVATLARLLITTGLEDLPAQGET